MRVWVLSLAVLLAISGMPGELLRSASGAHLKERDMVAPVWTESMASIVSENWFQITLREKEYNTDYVANTSYYSVTSHDDPDYASGVSPSVIHYRFYPEEAPYCEAHTICSNIADLHVIYRIYLQMPVSKPLKEGKTYTITIHPNVVQVNPLTVSFTFHLIRGDNDTVVYTGDVHLERLAAQEKWGKSDLYSLDFTSYETEGIYYLHVPGVGVSFPFVISETVYLDQIGYTLIRGLTMQRDGDHGLDDPNVTHWTRPSAHLDDAIDEASGLRVDLVGGHMDAGDRGKYPLNVAATVATMLAAAQLFPEEVEALGETLQLPETGNGIPDYLDELVYELDFLYKAVMNSSKGGALPWYLRPGNKGYEQHYPPEGATDRVFFTETEGPYKAETLYAAGALAMAYNNPLMQKYIPASWLEDYKTAALKAFHVFEQYKDSQTYWKEGGHDYFTTGTNPWSDEMLIAASNLLQITGEEKYLNWILSELPASMGADQKRWDG